MHRTGLLVVAWCLGIAPLASGAQAPACATSLTDWPAQQVRSFARYTVASMDSEDVAIRVTNGMPTLDSTRVVMINDDRVCSRIAAAINVYRKTPGRAMQLQVARLPGWGYMACECGGPDVHPGGRRPVYVLSKRYAVRDVYLGL